MKKSMKLSLTGVLMLIFTVAGLVHVLAGSNSIPDAQENSNLPSKEIYESIDQILDVMGIDQYAVFTYTLQAGGKVIDEYSDLYSLADWDVVVIIQEGRTADQLTVTVEDCCIMGDTMEVIVLDYVLWYYDIEYGDYDSATSPDIATVSLASPVPGLIGWTISVALIHYTDAPGGFPAGYYFSIAVD